ncbi:phosphoglycerate mutase family protein [Nocardia huaxiensis]|uniref:phosphoglycerate mutase family protein n=1 Tax=Nocardia huaxiensis TaxID=2755382 RepID=UPI001E4478F8|nr:phosphoglycerate mutase family protein [Nocardia huaxiensis]UFS98265.1 histidine phosphatase family protein [Nocardia huaxiensis]
MAVLLVRHGLSEANNRHNLGTPAFGAADARLMEFGRQQAALMGQTLRQEHGIDCAAIEVAVSGMARTRETALAAGFVTMTEYPALNEVDQTSDRQTVRRMIDERRLSVTALAAAEAVLADPPRETIWITHGLLIAALCRLTGVPETDRFIPRFCEIRRLPLPGR